MTLSLTPITPGSLAIGPVFNVTDGTTEVVRPGTVEFAGATVTESPTGTALVTPGARTIDLSLTTNPNTFLVAWEYDFGQVTPLFLSILLTAVVADGETFGSSPGQISLYAGTNVLPPLEGQRDDDPLVLGWTTFLPSWGVLNANVNDGLSSVGEYAAWTMTSPQCIRIKPGFVYIGDSNGDTYAGPNHPTATFRLYVEYV